MTVESPDYDRQRTISCTITTQHTKCTTIAVMLCPWNEPRARQFFKDLSILNKISTWILKNMNEICNYSASSKSAQQVGANMQYFSFKYNLDRSAMYSKFNPTRV